MFRPSRREFQELARLKFQIPVATSLPLEALPHLIYEAMDYAAPTVFLESARAHPVTGRYSLIVGEPALTLVAKGDRVWLTNGGDTSILDEPPLQLLQRLLDAKPTVRIPGFPPFVGGAVGFFGFDAYRYMETIPSRASDDLRLPDLFFFFCDQAVVIDHLLQKMWVVVLADPANGANRAYDEAIGRMDALIRRATRSPENGVRHQTDTVSDTPSSTHTRESFEAMVRQAQRYISDGEIYQANLSQRFAVPQREEPWTLYQRLRTINPSPFSAFADFGSFQVVSASPERFLRVQGRTVETRPIAGTRPKGKTAVETARLRQDLILNEKERAEHLMLVDLERNDLGRVCRYGSVRVDEMMVLEEYSHVIHIVSNVRGTLQPTARPMDLVAAAFPGGTITGCPKIRSIEIIDELEPVRRQLYTGSLGYIGYTGDMDMNLLIRTALVARDTVYVQTGAGIVADSDPGREFEETMHKAQALMETLHADAEVAAAVAAP